MSWTSALSGAIDTTIKMFSPMRALRREQARARIDMLGAYRGAERNRFRDAWLPAADSADAALLPDLALLRQRARDLVRNDGTASGIASTITVNTVGTGIQPQSRPDVDGLGITEEQAEDFATQTERVWSRWAPEADAQERLHFVEMQALVERQILENGEVLLLPTRIESDHRFLPLAFEVIEADRLQTPTDQRSRRDIRSGVELGDRGQPIAYWINVNHPGDRGLMRVSTSQDFIRYPARNDRTGERNMFHLYWTKRPRQTRGEPFFASVLTHFKDLADYLEAELVAARIQACFALIFESKDPYGLAGASATGADAQGRRLTELEPGLVHYAENGEIPHAFNPSRPTTAFDPFVDKMLRMIGSSLGLPYELVMKDFSKVNYSSARASLMEARRFFRCRQQFHSLRMGQPVWDMVQREAYVQGELRGINLFAREADLWLKAAWIAPGWGFMDPTKEVAAAQEAIRSGLSTLPDECAALGGKDWQENALQNKRAQKFYEDHEIQGGPWDEPSPTPQATPAAPSAADGPAKDGGDGANEPNSQDPQPENIQRDHTGPALFSDAQTNGHCVGV
ncbi:MAG: phage portal protein [Gammaproteobacteria bacterium]|nr:phage portal protein [Gammaproteobacteria bacterium]